MLPKFYWAVSQLERKLNIDIFNREYFCDDEVNEAIEGSKFVIKEFPYANRGKRISAVSFAASASPCSYSHRSGNCEKT